MAGSTSNRGFASMDKNKQRAIAAAGGRASSGSFTKGDPRASAAGRRGAENQPIEAKRRGGQNSHRNS